jgi:hypothetical protein
LRIAVQMPGDTAANHTLIEDICSRLDDLSATDTSLLARRRALSRRFDVHRWRNIASLTMSAVSSNSTSLAVSGRIDGASLRERLISPFKNKRSLLA